MHSLLDFNLQELSLILLDIRVSKLRHLRLDDGPRCLIDRFGLRCLLICTPNGTYNGRNTAEQWVKEGKCALSWTQLSCHRFVANQVRLALFILAFRLRRRNFMRRLCPPDSVKHWSLRSLKIKLIKIGGRLGRHPWRLAFQLAGVAVPREVFRSFPPRKDWSVSAGSLLWLFR